MELTKNQKERITKQLLHILWCHYDDECINHTEFGEIVPCMFCHKNDKCYCDIEKCDNEKYFKEILKSL